MQKGFMLMIMAIIVHVTLLAVEFDLNRYQTPSNMMRGLEVGFGNLGNTQKLDDITKSNLDTSIWGEYFENRFSRKEYLNWSLKLSNRYYQNSTTRDDSTEYERDTQSYRPLVEIYGDYRRYLTGSLFFNVEAGGGINGTYTKTEAEQITYKYETDSDLIRTGLSGSLGAGYGRIEDVTRARQALYILDELKEAGLLKRIVQEEDVRSLADLLISLNYLRLFDSRLVEQERLRQIINHLKGKGLIEEAEVESFVIIYDLYKNGALFIRKSGWEIYPLAGFHYENSDLERSSNTVATDTTNSYKNMDFEDNYNIEEHFSYLKINYSHILNRDWQLNFSSNVGYLWKTRDDEDINVHEENSVYDTTITKYNYDIEGLDYSIAFQLDWYPDTRTMMWSHVSFEYSSLEGDGIKRTYYDEADLELKMKQEVQSFYFSTGISYYFSPQLSAVLMFSVQNYRRLYENISPSYYYDDDFRAAYRLTINYSIF